jgi:hypothetical protein
VSISCLFTKPITVPGPLSSPPPSTIHDHAFNRLADGHKTQRSLPCVPRGRLHAVSEGTRRFDLRLVEAVTSLHYIQPRSASCAQESCSSKSCCARRCQQPRVGTCRLALLSAVAATKYCWTPGTPTAPCMPGGQPGPTPDRSRCQRPHHAACKTGKHKQHATQLRASIAECA